MLKVSPKVSDVLISTEMFEEFRGSFIIQADLMMKSCQLSSAVRSNADTEIVVFIAP